MLRRRELVERLLRDRPPGMLVVSGLGSPSWDVTAAGDDARNFQFIGAMGQAGAFALGVALAQPAKRVVLITGDGELLMGMGVLATIANEAPTNLGLVVLDNEAYAETGGQPTATRGPTDLAAVAAACGIGQTRTIRGPEEIATAVELVIEQPGPVVLVAKIALEDSKLPMTFPFSFDGVTALNRFREAAKTP